MAVVLVASAPWMLLQPDQEVRTDLNRWFPHRCRQFGRDHSGCAAALAHLPRRTLLIVDLAAAAIVAGAIILRFQPSFAAILAIGPVQLIAYSYWRNIRIRAISAEPTRRLMRLVVGLRRARNRTRASRGARRQPRTYSPRATRLGIGCRSASLSPSDEPRYRRQQRHCEQCDEPLHGVVRLVRPDRALVTEQGPAHVNGRWTSRKIAAATPKYSVPWHRHIRHSPTNKTSG